MFIYTFACHEDEAGLCGMEQRALLGTAYADVKPALEVETAISGIGSENPVVGSGERSVASRTREMKRWIRSGREIDPGRSPFLKERLRIEGEYASLQELKEAASAIGLAGCTFKVRWVNTGEKDKLSYNERLEVEREVGACIRGRADMRRPQRLIGAARLDGKWVIGELTEAGSAWRARSDKPRQYSTALGIRAARAAVNIAVPDPAGIRAVDPCCGIGTVLLEAWSMGIEMDGFDINPLAARGAKENMRHFGYPAQRVRLGDMRAITAHYDAAILDMPYNLCSVSPRHEQLELLSSLRSMAGRAVVISTEPVEPLLAEAGFDVTDRCEIRKGEGAFRRQLFLCR